MLGFRGIWLVPAIGLAVACGARGPALVRPTPRASAPPPVPAPSGAPALPDTPAARIVADTLRTFRSIGGYRTHMRFFQKNGSRTSRGLYDLTGKPGPQMRIEILEGTARGTRLLWTGGQTVKARPAGLLSAIVVNLPLDDDRLVSVRGYTLAQTNLDALLGILASSHGKVSYLGQHGSVDILTTTGDHLLPGCRKMTASIDRATRLPVGADLSDGREIVFQVRLSGFRPDPTASLEI